MSTEVLAQQIGRIAGIDGDHTTAFAPLSLHRRSARTEPLPCIYGLGLAVVAQGRKQAAITLAIVQLARQIGDQGNKRFQQRICGHFDYSKSL